ncbi:uncharacterized protein LOC144204373 isoform X4 [Stigmatopora nigra]
MSAEQVSDIVCDPSSESPTSAGHKPANFTLSASMRALMEARSTAIVSVLSQRRMNKDMGQWTGLQKDSPSQVDMQMRISHEAEENRMIISEIRRLQQEITLQENEEEQEEK